ncbi:AraC family transcriptional regulator [Bordetella trematum]|uniref:AraC family transcriptional regulator n=1 Tax=Bordetella trematum TaxID=123899 RepID=UPI0009DD456B|nr:helix-turn-helix transcriptional regulator [Bordetella trematum]
MSSGHATPLPPAVDYHALIDSPQAPQVLALSVSGDDEDHGDPQQHRSGQLYCLKQGLMVVQCEAGLFVSPPRFVGWIPPLAEHAVAGRGPIEGWTVFIKAEAVQGLPSQPALLAGSPLLAPLAERLAQWQPEAWRTPEYLRMSQVFLDEVRLAPVQGLSLPMPEDRRLRAIARVLIEQPADPRSASQLARWAGLSARSLTRHWAASVGMSLAKYRQVARLLKSLDGLSQGQDVQQVAWSVGFESVSAYIHAFKGTFGFTPGKYFAR